MVTDSWSFDSCRCVLWLVAVSEPVVFHYERFYIDSFIDRGIFIEDVL